MRAGVARVFYRRESRHPELASEGSGALQQVARGVLAQVSEDLTRGDCVTCRNCGAELPVGAKFCHECGTAVGDEAPTEVVTPQEAEADVQAEAQAEAEADAPQVPLDGQPSVAPEDIDVQLVDPADPVEAPPVEPVDDTETGVTSPALQQQVPTPPREPKPARERRPLEEQGAWEEFTAAVVPLLRAPRFTGNLLAAFVAFAVSFAAALAIWALLDNAFDRHAGLVLPGFVDTDRDGVGVLALLTLVLHQVPMINDEDVSWGAPLLLALVPLLGCAVGVVVGRRVMPCSGRGRSFPSRVAPFALLYGVILFFWSLFGAQDWHAAHVSSFLAGVVFAILGAWIAERWLARRGEAPATRTAGARTDQPADPVVRRELAAVRTAARVLSLMLLIGAVGWLAGTIIEATQLDRDRGAAVAAAVLQVGEGGFKALGFGVLAEGDPFGVAERVRIYDAAELMHDAAFVIMLVTALAVVVVGGLFSGFAIARRVAPRSRNDHALFGAVTGPVWAVAMLVAQFVVLSRYRQGDDTFTSFDGTETFFLSLLVGTVLGALGGLLAAHSRRSA